MIKILKNTLYILVAVFLILLINILVFSQIKLNKEIEKEPTTPISEKTDITLDTKIIDEFGLYKEYGIDLKNIPENTDSKWYNITLNETTKVKFQYVPKNNELYNLDLYVNDIKLENITDYEENDKFNIHFYIYNDKLVVEHKKNDDTPSFVKIINLNTQEITNLVGEQNFYLNDVKIDRYGINASFSRQVSKISALVSNKETKFTFTLEQKEITVDACKKNTTWNKKLKKAKAVYYEVNYINNNNNLDIENPIIKNKQGLTNYLNPYMKTIKQNCK